MATKLDDALFLRICELLDELEAINKSVISVPKRRLHIRSVSRWFDKFSSGDIYLGFRLFVPELDLGRVYYLKEKKLASHVAELLGLSDTSRGKHLLNWRVDERAGRTQGDLGTVLCDLVKQTEHCLESTLTVKQLNELLDELVSSKRVSAGFTQFDAVKGRPILQKLYQNMTSREIRWLTKIILKDLQIKVEPRVFFDAFHGWMWKIYLLRNDLKLACELTVSLIKKGYNSAAKITDSEFIEVSKEFFRPLIGTNITIMACGRAQGIQHVAERMNGKTCYVEQKYDGERLQAHMCKSWPEKIKIFSKSGRDSTNDRYRCHQQLLRAMKFLDLENTIERAIVEGELLVFNEETRKIENFGTVQDLQAWKSNYRGDIVSGSRHYIVILFDLLHLNGQDLTHKPLEFRRRLLETLVVIQPNHVELTKVDKCSFPQDIQRFSELYAEALAQRMEGLIIKNVESQYIPGNRSEWLKLKKDYIEGFGDTAEFAAIGLSYGKGSDSGGLLKKWIIGALTNKAELDEGPSTKPHFILLFPVENGLTLDELQLFHHLAIQNCAKPSESSNLTYSYSFAPGYRDDLDFIVSEPFLVELLGSGFIKERGQSHFVLRFPRILKVFLDRSAKDAVSFQELQDMAKDSFSPEGGHEIEKHSNNLLSHMEKHKLLGKRAPENSRPNRLVFDGNETLSKLIRRMQIKEPSSPLDQLRSKYFFHLPTCLENYDSLMEGLTKNKLEYLYNLVAVAECDNRSCIVVLPEDSSKICASLKDLGCRKDIFSIELETFMMLLEAPDSFDLGSIKQLDYRK